MHTTNFKKKHCPLVYNTVLSIFDENSPDVTKNEKNRGTSRFKKITLQSTVIERLSCVAFLVVNDIPTLKFGIQPFCDIKIIFDGSER